MRKEASTPLVRSRTLFWPFVLRVAFFKQELKGIVASKRYRLWRDTEGQRYSRLRNSWEAGTSTDSERAYGLKRITEFLKGHYLLNRHSRSLNLAEYVVCRFCSEVEETP